MAALIDFGSRNRDFPGGLDSDLDRIAVDPRYFDVD